MVCFDYHDLAEPRLVVSLYVPDDDWPRLRDAVESGVPEVLALPDVAQVPAGRRGARMIRPRHVVTQRGL